MVFTSYTEKEYQELPAKYKGKVVGIIDSNQIIQLPLCPECGSEMMEEEGDYLSCVECGVTRKKRVIKQ